MTLNLQVRLRRIPTNVVEASDFTLIETPLPAPAHGEVLVRHLWLSLDPYMRKRLADAAAGRATLAPGDLMMGRTVGMVALSRDVSFQPGDLVLGWGGWQRWSVEPAHRLEKLQPPAGVPPSAYLCALGRPGITAWLGVMHISALRAGEHFLVSSAAGAVGALAGQIARHLGARVVGIAGGAAKCEAVEGELGFAACVDHKSAQFERALQAATPHGVDVLFENVGGAVLDAGLGRMNTGGRITVCGLLAHYRDEFSPGLQNLPRLMDRGLCMRGFGIDAHVSLHAQARRQMAHWYADGVFRTWETVAAGLAAAPSAFIGMLEGRGRGKTLVRLE
ncbi:NADP-dependent oxidoreductase [uncultured Pseudacidovorax sp.]|uniref:MDR family NADP-dependent oxidoreductase n=1 Tax=uncultured Pseudacidovorax sp. TaxID=679313 RepID=UPI0025FA543E|nr:NADP-dependent oxidoreductase [uncultured Pseudacidovorax sp.]